MDTKMELASLATLGAPLAEVIVNTLVPKGNTTIIVHLLGKTTLPTKFTSVEVSPWAHS